MAKKKTENKLTNLNIDKKIIGVDVGTMNLVVSSLTSDNKIEQNRMRNMFLEFDTDLLNDIEMDDNGLFDYILDEEENKLYILGEESFVAAKTLGLIPKRPMSGGVISSSEVDSIDILTIMMEKLAGRGDENGERGCAYYSIPAQSVDVDMPPVSYHERVFKRIFKSLGYDPKPINEAMALIYSNCSSTGFTGISFSFGCGMTNVVFSYKGIKVTEFSIVRGGDWIDKCVSDAVNKPISRITNIKEKKLNLLKYTNSDKQEKRVIEALQFYYEDLLEYVIEQFNEEFKNNAEDLDIEEDIPIIISGGTSLPEGFVEKFKEIFEDSSELPFEVSDFRRATDPLYDVSKGCLIKLISDIKHNTENKNEAD